MSDDITRAAEQLAAAGLPVERCRDLAEECARAAASLGLALDLFIDRLSRAVTVMGEAATIAADRLNLFRETVVDRARRDLLEWMDSSAPKLAPPCEPAPHVAGWQIGGIRAARRNRLRGRRR